MDLHCNKFYFYKHKQSLISEEGVFQYSIPKTCFTQCKSTLLNAEGKQSKNEQNTDSALPMLPVSYLWHIIHISAIKSTRCLDISQGRDQIKHSFIKYLEFGGESWRIHRISSGKIDKWERQSFQAKRNGLSVNISIWATLQASE